ncbi:hypothetical protein RJ639_014392 [Escallonia herrerae]|uniref:DNA helicase Pif1-like 2B domain-containing protein n=1 Tax=Escallonia herrerae TaxID=1293975 RepID=A0AA89AMH5_9ASTE|nr:hypothetical protein RJ639_014392 [Escallonia herrerae]
MEPHASLVGVEFYKSWLVAAMRLPLKANDKYEFAKSLTYSQFPEYFVWDRDALEWDLRKRRNCIGRMVYVHPTCELLIKTGENPIQEIVNVTYPNLLTKHKDGKWNELVEWLCNRAILTPKNEQVEKINSYELSTLPGEVTSYKSSDMICKASTTVKDHELLYPIEFLNSLKFSGIPNHDLDLKIGAPIMLMRNINPSKGLCDGTISIVTQL